MGKRKTVSVTKKSNSKHYFLRDTLGITSRNSFDMNEKKNNKNNNLKKPKNFSMDCKVVLENINDNIIMKNKEKNKLKEKPILPVQNQLISIEKNITMDCKVVLENIDDNIIMKNKEKNKLKEKPILPVQDQLISAENQFKTNTEIKTVEFNPEQSTQKIEKKSSILPDNNDDERLAESSFLYTPVLEKTRKVPFNENSNETVLNKNKSNLKDHHGRLIYPIYPVYQKHINDNLSKRGCRHKRKLLEVIEKINEFHKRFKTS